MTAVAFVRRAWTVREQTMQLSDYLTCALLLAGAVFFLAGTVGLLRFPDVYTRLHA